MIKIAICDDDRKFTLLLREEILNILEREVQIDAYSESVSLKNVIEKQEEHYDLILLDIDMPKYDGLTIASIIRQHSINVLVIFLTTHDKYVFEAIKFNPYRYIRKNRVKIELKEALLSARKNIENNDESYYLCKSGGQVIRLWLKDIVYFEIINKKVNFYMYNGEVVIEKTTISKVLSTINREYFVQIHSGAVVNLAYVNSFTRFDVGLDSGEKLILSRHRYKEFASVFSRYLGERL